MVQELGGAVDQASPAHAQCPLPVQPASLVDVGRQRQTQVCNNEVLLSMLSEDVTQILREGHSERRETVNTRTAAEITESCQCARLSV